MKHPGDLTPAERTAHQTSAMLFPAPEIPDLPTRPFNDTVAALCQQCGLTVFTGELIGADPDGLTDRARAVGLPELNRQSLILLFLVAYPDKKEMLRAIRTPSFYEDIVIPWSLDLPHNPQRMSKLMSEWLRYMLETAAAIFQLLPKDGEAAPDAPPNS